MLCRIFANCVAVKLSRLLFVLLFVLHAAAGVAAMEPTMIEIYDQIGANARARSDQRFYQDVAKVRVGRCPQEYAMGVNL